jgi:capsid protein
MSLQTRIESLVIRLAQEFNTLHAKTGTLASLSTTDKSSLVAAINELQASIVAGSGIDDNAVGLGSTYSSSKIVSLLDNLKAEIVGDADAAYDTLLKIQQLLQDGTSGLDALLVAVNHRVRFDAPQTLSSVERQQALDNLGAVSADAVGNTDADFVAIFEGALV